VSDWPERLITIFSQIADNIPTPKALAWDTRMAGGVIALTAVWCALFAAKWGRWGDVTVDSGREMYVPWQLLKGATLYRDVWYPYTPGAPYLNRALFQLFGVRLEALYWAGALSALICCAFLFLIGARMSNSIAGLTAGMVVLVEAFVPMLFSYPLPYSFAAVYGSVAATACLWACVEAFRARHPFRWITLAASCAAAAVLFKMELGAGCYAAVFIAALAQFLRNPKLRTAATVVLATLPGMAACLATLWWMISLDGFNFITQENFMSWPSSYFMKRYGPLWLRYTGFSLEPKFLLKMALAIIVIAGYFALRLAIQRYSTSSLQFVFAAACLLAVVVWLLVAGGNGRKLAQMIFFPPAMPFAILLSTALALFGFFRTRAVSNYLPTEYLGIVALSIGSSMMALRSLAGLDTIGYSIYDNGLVLLVFLLLLGSFQNRSSGVRSLTRGDLLIYAMVFLAGVFGPLQAYFADNRTTPLSTDRGVIYLSHVKALRYRSAIAFMKEAARQGRVTLSIPEDAALYFLSGTDCPTRTYAFTPGAIVPGKMMAQTLSEIERKRVHYLIWSNREFPEYGTRTFGVDFDVAIGEYFRSNYHPIGPVSDVRDSRDWNATIWERNASENRARSANHH
jgi:hypothetical protein